ncbi:MAG: hypothetical protein JEZ02_08025 [Desulfatibacillum sp.]|nr:hypothetical protein [Desulfatibacillum sp.]
MSWFRKNNSEEKSNKIKILSILSQAAQWFFPVLALALAIVLILFARELSQIRQWQILVQKSLPITFAKDFQLDATIDHEFPIKLDTEIPVQFPVTSVVRIPIKETFMIPLDQTFSVMVNKPFRLKDTVRVRAQVPIDIEVETKVLGVTMTVPVKGVLPLDIDVPLDQEIQIPGEIMVMLQKPLPVSIDQTVEAPLNFTVNGIMPLDTTILAPVRGVLDCGISIKESVPVEVELAVSMNDLLTGVSLRK